jgi:hypothetical protein
VAPPPIASAADLTDANVQAKYANAYWKRHSVPNMRQYGYKRIAVVEFAVEFVTSKREESDTKHISYSQYLYDNLPTELHNIFCQELRSHDLTVVSPQTLRGSRSYARFEVAPDGYEPSMDGAHYSSSDTGRVKKIKIYSADGLKIIKGAGTDDIEDAEADLLKELSADVALRVRIRVGFFNGHASIERGSVVWVLSKDVAGNLTADRSLVSDIEVVESTKGSTIDIFVPRYEQAMREMFPAFIAMAFMSGESSQEVK